MRGNRLIGDEETFGEGREKKKRRQRVREKDEKSRGRGEEGWRGERVKQEESTNGSLPGIT